jgi:hypothetical protein
MTLVALSAITAAAAITFMRSFIRVISFSSLLPSLRRIEKLMNCRADALASPEMASLQSVS